MDHHNLRFTLAALKPIMILLSIGVLVILYFDFRSALRDRQTRTYLEEKARYLRKLGMTET